MKDEVKTKVKNIQNSHITDERIKKRKENEDAANELLRKNIGKLSKDDLKKILIFLDTDYSEGHVHIGRFGVMIRGNNRQLILQNDIKEINNLIRDIYSEEDLNKADYYIDKLSGINEGFISALLYLKNRDKYNLFFNALKKGADVVNNRRIDSRLKFKDRYLQFNEITNDLKKECSLKPQEIDIILTVLPREAEEIKTDMPVEEKRVTKEIIIVFPKSFIDHGQLQKNFRKLREIPDEISKIDLTYSGKTYTDLKLGKGRWSEGRIYFSKVKKEEFLEDSDLEGGERITLQISYPSSVIKPKIDKPIIEIEKPIGNLKTWDEWEKVLNYELIDKSFEINSLYFEPKDKKNLEKQITTSLKNGKHIILIGPPGSGKSKLAKEICKFYCGEHKYRMHTATADWSTFDTIGGYRPLGDGSLEFFPGIFLQTFKDRDVPVNRWLIIDEINRADIDKAFGSLFSALTGDNIILPFEIGGEMISIIGDINDKKMIIENHNFIIHPHWRIIATMNWFDKSSLYEMSYAFMRRFAFIPVYVPKTIDSDLIKKYLEKWNESDIKEDICKDLASLWNIINDHREIGPAIIEDMYKYLKDHDPRDYVSALIMYVLPQFEGLSKDKQSEFIIRVLKEEFITDKDRLEIFASGFFETEMAFKEEKE